MTELTFLNVEGIGVMVSVDDMIEALQDAMLRSDKGSAVWTTYNEVAVMLETLAEEYMNEDVDIECEGDGEDCDCEICNCNDPYRRTYLDFDNNKRCQNCDKPLF
jgi:Zn finger protein HypA/HybF involved in hydrogenase expression